MPARAAGLFATEEGQDQVRGDWRDLIEPRLAQLALNMVLLGESETAMGLGGITSGGNP